MSRAEQHARSVVANFDAEAARWRDNYRSGGPMRSRFGLFITALEQAAPRPAEVLDFGCGTGDLSLMLRDEGWRVVGCDASPAMLEQARRAAPTLPWSLLDATGDRPLPFAAGRFDAVIASSVFEYLADPAQALRRLGAVLRPGGALLMTVPDPRCAVRRREAFWQALARSPLAYPVLHRTRWRPYFSYLRLSINRFPLAQWAGLLADSGFILSSMPEQPSPLALIVARKG